MVLKAGEGPARIEALALPGDCPLDNAARYRERPLPGSRRPTPVSGQTVCC